MKIRLSDWPAAIHTHTHAYTHTRVHVYCTYKKDPLKIDALNNTQKDFKSDNF